MASQEAWDAFKDMLGLDGLHAQVAALPPLAPAALGLWASHPEVVAVAGALHLLLLVLVVALRKSSDAQTVLFLVVSGLAAATRPLSAAVRTGDDGAAAMAVWAAPLLLIDLGILFNLLRSVVAAAAHVRRAKKVFKKRQSDRAHSKAD